MNRQSLQSEQFNNISRIIYELLHKSNRNVWVSSFHFIIQFFFIKIPGNPKIARETNRLLWFRILSPINFLPIIAKSTKDTNCHTGDEPPGAHLSNNNNFVTQITISLRTACPSSPPGFSLPSQQHQQQDGNILSSHFTTNDQHTISSHRHMLPLRPTTAELEKIQPCATVECPRAQMDCHHPLLRRVSEAKRASPASFPPAQPSNEVVREWQ